MNYFFKSTIILTLSIWSSIAFSAVNLNVKIGQFINNQLIEVNKNISSDFNKEIIIQDESLKDRIVLSLKKFKNVIVNGQKIEPVQINLKTVNSDKKMIGKVQTVTSFYNNEANFIVSSTNANKSDLEINLQFTEIN